MARLPRAGRVAPRRTRAAPDALLHVGRHRRPRRPCASCTRSRSRWRPAPGVRDVGLRRRWPAGAGITALFSGPSGTGKTMAAEILANHLQLDLYRIDLAGVVSKYIGETEKNLRDVFDAAEDSGAILFFDEADALFGKRTEVKDSHDRYANIEINYLLQRMEDYRGLAILCTNRRSALDRAFLRRLRFLVEFPFPDGEQPPPIWQQVFPRRGAVELARPGRAVPAGDHRRQHPQHRAERGVPGRRRSDVASAWRTSCTRPGASTPRSTRCSPRPSSAPTTG